MPGLYEYESKLADVSDRYAQDNVTNEYARFISKQRYSRQRQDQNQGFTRQFPQFTGQAAGRLGSTVQSGVFREKLNQNVGDFNQSQDRLNQDEAGYDSSFLQNQSLSRSAYERAILALQEQMGAGRAMQNPYSSYQSVYGGQ